KDGIRDATVTGVQTCALPILGDTSEHINQVMFKLNNASISPLGVITDKYLQANYPTGTRTIVWLDGVLKLYGNLVEFIPTYGKEDRKSTRLNSSHGSISYAVF